MKVNRVFGKVPHEKTGATLRFFLLKRQAAEKSYRPLQPGWARLLNRPLFAGRPPDKAAGRLKTRETGCETGERDSFTPFRFKDQRVGISGEEVKVKSEKTKFRVIPGQKLVLRKLYDGYRTGSSRILPDRQVMDGRTGKTAFPACLSHKRPNREVPKNDQQ